MGPPVEPTPLCSSSLTHSLILLLSLSVAPRSSSLFFPFFFFFSTKSPFFLGYFLKIPKPLFPVKPQKRRGMNRDGERAPRRTNRCGGEEGFFSSPPPSWNPLGASRLRSDPFFSTLLVISASLPMASFAVGPFKSLQKIAFGERK